MFESVPLVNRTWPTRKPTSPPIWLSTDLRDGNQALINPMKNSTKLKLFRMLCKIGFKEIEVAYPSSSDQEFEFVRGLIDNHEIPDGVAIQIITPCREDLIRRSIDSLAGSKKAIIHLYNAVSPVFREVVFRNSREKTLKLVSDSVKLVRQLTDECTARTGTHFQLNYCMETFSQTEYDFTVELGKAVLEAWGKAGPGDDRVMFNLAATVEVAPPNHYADQVEYFCSNIPNREHVIASLHPHNDRGTGVAATELGLLAGGQRVEGCLLGNGERTGNVDIITLALNLYALGISPKLDFSNLREITDLVCECNESVVPPRYPYSGDLVFTAFAGTHQDAIKKGFDKQAVKHREADKAGGRKAWEMPYIPIDPADLGFGYENLIRVSSQSGKAGAAYIVKKQLGLDLPRQMQPSFYRIVQSAADASGKEMTPKLVVSCFEREYFVSGAAHTGRIELRSIQLFSISAAGKVESPMSETSSDTSSDTETPSVRVEAEITVDGEERRIAGESSNALAAFAEAVKETLLLDADIKLQTHHEIPDSNQFGAFLEVHPREGSTSGKPTWGVGVGEDKTSAKLHAYVSGLNALIASGEHEFPRRRAFRPVLPSRRSHIGRPATPPVDMRTGTATPTTSANDGRWRRPEVAAASEA